MGILLSNAMLGVANILYSVLFVAKILILAYVVISWVSADRRNRLVQFIHSSTEPMLSPIRRKIPIIGGGIDLSPLVLFFLIIFLEFALVNSLRDYGSQIRQNALRNGVITEAPPLQTKKF